MAKLVALVMAAVMGAGSVSADDHSLLARALTGANGIYVSGAGDNEETQIVVPVWVMSWGGEACESRLTVGGLQAPQTWIIDWRRIESVQYDEPAQNLTLVGKSGGISFVGGRNVEAFALRLGPLRVDMPLRAMERIQAACQEPSS